MRGSAAAVDALKSGEVPPGHIAELVREIEPAVAAAQQAAPEDLLATVCAENVRQQVARLRRTPLIAGDGGDQEAIEIVGAVYDLSSGKVLVLDLPRA